MKIIRDNGPIIALVIGLILVVLSCLNYFATLGNRAEIKQMAVDRSRILRQMAMDNPTLKIPRTPAN